MVVAKGGEALGCSGLEVLKEFRGFSIIYLEFRWKGAHGWSWWGQVVAVVVGGRSGQW